MDLINNNPGLRDDSGYQYTPSVVRVGLHAHHSVQAVSMDNLVGIVYCVCAWHAKFLATLLFTLVKSTD